MRLFTRSRIAASLGFTQWFNCNYCDMPLPDCCCPSGIARRRYKNMKKAVANDNSRFNLRVS